MNNSGGSLDYEAYIKTDQFKQGIRGMGTEVRGLTKTVTTEADKMNETFKSLGQAAAGYFAFDQLSGLPNQLINVRGAYQQLETSFKTMLGSKALADKLMADVVKFAATTPFDLQGVAGATKQLLAYGFASEDVLGTLRRLGDISSGLNIPLGELTELYGKAKVEGRVMAEDLNQFVGRGIPLIKLLAEEFKVAEKDVRGLVEQGKVGFAQVERAINKLTDAGGTFAGLTAENAKSLTGLYSNLEDSIDQAFNKIGKQNEELLGDSIKLGIAIAENYEPILDVLKVIIAAYGTYQAAIMATAAIQAIAARGGAVIAWFELATSIRSAKDAQIAFNLATKANPYALAASALIALVTAVALFKDETNEATRAQDRALAIAERLNEQHAKEASKIQILSSQIADESRTREDRNNKLKELISISPKHFDALTLDNFATNKGTIAIQEYTKALETKLSLQAKEEQIIANNKRSRDISTGVLDDEFKPGMGERVKLFLEDKGFDEKKYKAETEKRKQAAIKALKSENDALIKEAASGVSKGSATVAPPSQKPKVKAAADSEKDIRIKTFAEEIEEKQKMYAVYQRWVSNYGSEAAQEQFKDLLSNGSDYVAYLNKEIARIETMRDVGYSGKLSDTDKVDLDNLITQRKAATGGPSVIDQFKTSLEEAKEESGSLTNYLGYLKQAQEALNKSAPTKDVLEQREVVAKATIEAQKQRKQLLDGFLIDTEGSEQQRVEIENHYAELRADLEDRFQERKTDAYEKALDLINQAEAREQDERKRRIYEASQEFTAMVQAVEDATGSSGLFDEINKRRDLVAGLLANEGYSDRYFQELKKLRSEEARTYAEIGGMIREIGDALGDAGGTLGQIGGAIAGIASQGNNLITVWDKNSSATQKWGAATQSVANLINIAVSSARQRKQAEQEYYNSVIGQQSQYNLLLNEQLGLQSKAGASVFYTDFAGTLTDGYAKSADALDRYKKSLEALENGKAKTGQKTGIDLSKVGAGAASGATIGAIAGAGVFSWAGAAIGAVGGAVAGFFAGMKKKDTFTPLLEAWPELIDSTKTGIDSINIALAKTLIDNNLLDDSTKRNLQSSVEWAEAYKEAQAQIKSVISDLAGALGSDLRDGLVAAFRDGTSAADAFFKSTSKSLENLLSQMLFSKVMGPAFDKLEAEMAISSDIDKGGDGSWVDDYGRFFAKQNELNSAYFDQMKAAQEEAEKHGLKLWQPIGSESGKPDPLSGSVKGMTAEEAGVLIGQFNAVRISNADIASSMRQMLIYQANISKNTDLLRYMPMMEEMVYEMKKWNGNSMRWWG